MSPDQNYFNAVPFFIIQVGTSRGAKHGKSEEQLDHSKANVYLPRGKKQEHSAILDKFQNQASYLDSQMTTGCAEEEKSRELYRLASDDTSCTATTGHRSRYENDWKLSVNGQGPRPSPTDKTEDHFQP